MQHTLIESDGKWVAETRLIQPTDDTYFISTVSHLHAEPGDIVTVFTDDETPVSPGVHGHDFEAVVLGTDPLTISPEVQDAF